VVNHCARCAEPSEDAVCPACLRYLWFHEPLRFDVRLSPAPSIRDELLQGAIAVLSSEGRLDFRDANPELTAAGDAALTLRHLPYEGESLLPSEKDREAIHRALLQGYREPPEREEDVLAFQSILAHAVAIPGLPTEVSGVFRLMSGKPPESPPSVTAPAEPLRARVTVEPPPVPVAVQVERVTAKSPTPAPATSSSTPSPPILLTAGGASQGAPAPEPKEIESSSWENAQQHLEVGNFEDALAAFDAHLAQDPKDARGWFDRGEVLNMLDRQEEALESYTRCLALDPGHRGALAEQSALYVTLGKVEEGMATLRRLLDADPARTKEFLLRAEDLRRRGNPRDALLLYNVIHEVDPESVDAQVGTGQALLDLGDAVAADETFTQAVADNPESPTALYHKGSMLLRQGRWGAAVQFFNRAIAQQWNYADAWIAKAQVLVKLAKGPEALDTLQKVMRFAGDRPDLWETKAQAHLHEGELEKALEAYRKMLQLDPTSEIAKMGIETLTRQIPELKHLDPKAQN